MEASIIYPHQLFTDHPAIKKGRRIFIIEEPLFFTEFPIHNQKLLLHRLSMQAYCKDLISAGHSVEYLEVTNFADTQSSLQHISNQGYTTVHITDTTDYWLEQRIEKWSQESGVETVRYESPLFLLSKNESKQRYVDSKKHLAKFYKQLRIDKDVLMNDTTPAGGQWSFDHDNRKKIPKGHVLPIDPEYYSDTNIQETVI